MTLAVWASIGARHRRPAVRSPDFARRCHSGARSGYPRRVNDDHVLRVPGVELADLSMARSFVRSELTPAVPEDVVSDLVLIASELVTNVWAHAAPASVNLGVSVTGDRATVTVESINPAAWFAPDVADWTMAAPEELTGRGLAVVRTIADGVDIDQRGLTLVISAHRCLNAGSGNNATR